MISFAERLKAVRKKKGITQKQLADLLGIPYQGISQYERGIRQPKYQTIERIAKALECDISELIDVKQRMISIVESYISENREDVSAEDEKIMYDAIEDTFSASPLTRYTRFISKHPALMQMISDIGIELEVIDSERIRIRYASQEKETDTLLVFGDLSMIYTKYIKELKCVFAENYRIRFKKEE